MSAMIFTSIRISIHALREEGDARSAALWHDSGNFYPRPPRGGRLFQTQSKSRGIRISIHALREEGDVSIQNQDCQKGVFLSTPSARRAT